VSRHGYLGLAWLAAASALIHAVVVPEHLREWGPEGIFFAVTAVVQVTWAVLIYRSPSRPLLLVGVAGNAALISIWLYSRAIGIPVGPHTGELEAVGALDVLASLDEVVSLLMLGVLLAGRTLRAGFTAAAATTLVGLTMLSVTTLSSGHSHGDGHDHLHASASP
jgi:hypothetical protein